MSEYPYNLALLFDTIVKLNHNKKAFVYSSQVFYFQDLERDVAKVVSKIKSLGLKLGEVILILNNKDYPFYVLMLACIKCGIIYSNIDPNINQQWLVHIFNICNPSLFVGNFSENDSLKKVSEDHHISTFNVENLFSSSSESLNKPLSIAERINGNHIAYIMFTSGSTGKPKGVAISHQNLLHFIEWGKKKFQVTVEDTFVNVNPMYFDNSVFDFYVSIFNGASLAPIHQELIENPVELIKTVDRLRCTLWFSVPSLLIYLLTLKVLKEHHFKNLRIIAFGGEGFFKKELKKLYDLYSPRIKFVNVYGPTECTCICSSYDITEKDFDDMTSIAPIGALNQNISALVLDEKGEEAPIGELCLLGPNLASGYYNDPEKTSQSFLKYQGKGYCSTTLYKTGDIVERKGDLFFFMGRKDNQIKRMGYRIELESIEYALCEIEGIFEAAVLSVKNPVNQMNYLFAYIGSDHLNLNIKEVDKILRKKLPNYMIPNRYILKDHLPKNANGKIDKKQLKNNEEIVLR